MRWRPAAAAVLALFVFASCGAGGSSASPGGTPQLGLPGDDPRPNRTWYHLRIGGAGTDITVSGTAATWLPDDGLLTLGPEEAGEPVAMLILHFAQDPEHGPYVRKATLSKTDKRVGTSDELNAMLFGAIDAVGGASVPGCTKGVHSIEGLGIGNDWISGSVCVTLDGLEPADVPPSVTVQAQFAAFEP